MKTMRLSTLSWWLVVFSSLLLFSAATQSAFMMTGRRTGAGVSSTAITKQQQQQLSLRPVSNASWRRVAFSVRGGASAAAKKNTNDKRKTKQQQPSRRTTSNATQRKKQQPLASRRINRKKGSTTASTKKGRSKIAKSGLLVATSSIGYVLYRERNYWLPLLDRELIQDKTLAILEKLQPPEDATFEEKTIAYATYILGMGLWEMVGLSTIPVETAAGMVFGYQKGVLCNVSGKLVGAISAYLLAKYLWRDRLLAHPSIADNKVFQLLNHRRNDDDELTHTHPPLLTAFLFKFSCFPEFIKNFGSGVVPAIELWMFVAVTLLHGGAFTLVWTWLGVDTARRLQTTATDVLLPTSRALHAALVVVGVVSLVVTPLTMAWWIRDLQRGAHEAELLQQRRPKQKHIPLPDVQKLWVWLWTLWGGNNKKRQVVVVDKKSNSFLARIRRYLMHASLAEQWFICLVITMLVVEWE